MLAPLLEILLRYDRWLLWLAIPLVSALMHGRIWTDDLTGPHVWRQTQTQETIDCFVEEDFCILQPRRLDRGNGDGIFRMEFPLFQWSVAAVAKVVGNSVLLTRFLTFLVGFAAMMGLHFLLIGLTRDRWVALLGSYLFAFSPVIFYYGVSPLPDLMALAFAFWGCGFMMRLPSTFSIKTVAAAAICLGLSTLVKLPYILFYAMPACWMVHALIFQKTWKNVAVAACLFALFLLPALAWYAWVIPTWTNNDVVTGLFTKGADYGLAAEILKDHFWEMIPRTLMSVAAVPLLLWGIVLIVRRGKPVFLQPVQRWMLMGFGGAFLAYYAFELLLINFYHDYYMQPLTLLLVIPQAIGAAWLIHQKKGWAIGLLALMLVLVPYMTHRRITPRWRPENAEFNRDYALHKEALRKAVPENALVVAGPDPSHHIVPYYIHKKGWIWDQNQAFSAAKLGEWRDQGAQFFYCHDRSYDTLPEVRSLLGQPIGVFGTVRVYRFREGL